MQPSPPRLPLVVEALCTADAVYGLIADIQAFTVEGRKDEARALLAHLADAVASHRPILRACLAAERQPAEVRDAAERTASTIARVLRRQPQEHLHAMNDHGLPASNHQPDPAA